AAHGIDDAPARPLPHEHRRRRRRPDDRLARRQENRDALRNRQGVLAGADAARRDAQGRQRDRNNHRADCRRDEVARRPERYAGARARSIDERIWPIELALISNFTKSPTFVRMVTCHPAAVFSTNWTRCGSIFASMTVVTRCSMRRLSTWGWGGATGVSDVGVGFCDVGVGGIKVECPQSWH